MNPKTVEPSLTYGSAYAGYLQWSWNEWERQHCGCGTVFKPLSTWESNSFRSLYDSGSTGFFKP